jgi:hypothetical protein
MCNRGDKRMKPAAAPDFETDEAAEKTRGLMKPDTKSKVRGRHDRMR